MSNPTVVTILHLFRTASNLCFAVVLLYIGLRETAIKPYAFYAAAFTVIMATVSLLRTRTVYRKAVAAKNGDASEAVKTEGLVKVDVQGDQKDANKAEEAGDLLV
ncbi:hypothetical protein BV22DRAFT_1031716 [Leucogyrophana mollusca]|uniref:Uncharacterized protein n=1 Tax=Leucogyrophana mollusca TaxID=85980 RepID=A0ACB8BQ88_9AGAM|nr:hypothetical protein BV22DRAFT_1031716 [Leucogyrophana mollusca]